MKKGRFESREDLQTLKDRLIGKRIVTAEPHIAEYKGWKQPTVDIHWEPRVYLCISAGEGIDGRLQYETQPTSPLLRLPAEIRVHILEYVVPPQRVPPQATDAAAIDQGDAPWMNTSAIIFCCKQLYVEARKLALESHAFEYEKFPRKTRFCNAQREESSYIWDR